MRSLSLALTHHHSSFDIAKYSRTYSTNNNIILYLYTYTYVCGRQKYEAHLPREICARTIKRKCLREVSSRLGSAPPRVLAANHGMTFYCYFISIKTSFFFLAFSARKKFCQRRFLRIRIVNENIWKTRFCVSNFVLPLATVSRHSSIVYARK